jgi:hypothetical protein
VGETAAVEVIGSGSFRMGWTAVGEAGRSRREVGGASAPAVRVIGSYSGRETVGWGLDAGGGAAAAVRVTGSYSVRETVGWGLDAGGSAAAAVRVIRSYSGRKAVGWRLGSRRSGMGSGG